VLAFYDIGGEPFWRDEAWSMSVADRSVPATVEVLVNRRESYMTLYYLLPERVAGTRVERGIREDPKRGVRRHRGPRDDRLRTQEVRPPGGRDRRGP
jgi:hypothetical protein